MRLRNIVDTNSFKKSGTKRYRNQAGYLVLPDCCIARSGVLQYSDVVCEDGDTVANGDLIPVSRPISALKNCYKQFADLPVTLRHPDDDAITPENAKGLTVGVTGSSPRFVEKDGLGYIYCDIIVYDEESQQKIEEGEYTELSAGYETAFRNKRGVTEFGRPYEAEQFLLSPNHVALVEQGRCGSDCKVCDGKESKRKQGDGRMARKKIKKSFRYFLSVGDGDEVVELTPEQAESMQEKDPNIEVEELDEEDVELEDTNIPGVETEETEEEVEDEEDEETEETEEEVEDEETEETEEEVEDEEDEDLTFEVRFEDGSVGRMDKTAYEHCKRLTEVAKGDSRRGDSIGKVFAVSAQAAKILGSSFDIGTFAKGDSINIDGIKRAVVKKMMPGVVTRGLKTAALDSLYNSACKTHSLKKDDFNTDIKNLCDVEESVVVRSKDGAEGKDMVGAAKQRFLNRLHGKNKE